MCSPIELFGGLESQQHIQNCLYVLYLYIDTIGSLKPFLTLRDMRRAICASGGDPNLPSSVHNSPSPLSKRVSWGTTQMYHQHTIDMLAYSSLKLPEFLNNVRFSSMTKRREDRFQECYWQQRISNR